MLLERTKRGARAGQEKLAARFNELALLQRALLDQQSEIETLRAQSRKNALAPHQTVAETSNAAELAAARERIAELERVQSDLVIAVNEKERQRFALAVELQDALVRAEEAQFATGPVPVFSATDATQDLMQLGSILRTQEALLREREEAIAELTTAARARDEAVTPQVPDRLLQAIMLEYHAMITAALAERDHAILALTFDPMVETVGAKAAR